MTNVWHHRPGIDLDVASIFDPLGNAVHTALSFDVLGAEDAIISDELNHTSIITASAFAKRSAIVIAMKTCAIRRRNCASPRLRASG